MIATFIMADGSSISVNAFNSVRAALHWAEAPVIDIQFSIVASTWINEPDNDRDKAARVKWIDECEAQIDDEGGTLSEVIIEDISVTKE